MSGIAVDQLQSSRHEVLPFFVRERVRLGTLFFRNDRAPGLFLRRWLFHGLPGKSGRNKDTPLGPGVNVIFTSARPAGITTSQRRWAAKDKAGCYLCLFPPSNLKERRDRKELPCSCRVFAFSAFSAVNIATTSETAIRRILASAACFILKDRNIDNRKL
jgi:hypothetical protein